MHPRRHSPLGEVQDHEPKIQVRRGCRRPAARRRLRRQEGLRAAGVRVRLPDRRRQGGLDGRPRAHQGGERRPAHHHPGDRAALLEGRRAAEDRCQPEQRQPQREAPGLQIPLDRPRRHARVGRGTVEAADALRELQPGDQHHLADQQGGRLPPDPEERGMSPALRLALAAGLAAAALAAGCAKEQTRYGDARAVETLTNQFGSTDLQLMAESMARSMLQAPVIASANLPIVTVQEVRNKTSEYIDTRAITDSIRSELQKGGRVRFAVDAAGMSQQTEELKRQQSELYAKDSAAEMGRMVGAQYRLEGNIISIVKQVKDTKDVYYKLNLQLWNIRNGLLEWSDEKEIRKTTTRG